MKRILLYLAILSIPFVVVIGVNETVRPTLTDPGYSELGYTAMNPVKATPEKCSWACHNGTLYCEKYHVSAVRPLMPFIRPFYYGLISLLMSTGAYGAANLLFLVILFPGLLFYWVVRSIQLQKAIKQLQKEHGNTLK